MPFNQTGISLCHISAPQAIKEVLICQGRVILTPFLQAPDLSNHVEALLMAVKTTNDFEAEMAQKFGGKQGSPDEADSVRHPDNEHSFHQPLKDA